MTPRILNINILDNYQIEITYQNGEIKIFDFTKYINYSKLTELKDKNIFKEAKVSYDTIEWPNGIDIDPDTLYFESKLK